MLLSQLEVCAGDPDAGCPWVSRYRLLVRPLQEQLDLFDKTTLKHAAQK
jgi:hypothetical protein